MLLSGVGGAEVCTSGGRLSSGEIPEMTWGVDAPDPTAAEVAGGPRPGLGQGPLGFAIPGASEGHRYPFAQAGLKIAAT